MRAIQKTYFEKGLKWVDCQFNLGRGRPWKFFQLLLAKLYLGQTPLTWFSSMRIRLNRLSLRHFAICMNIGFLSLHVLTNLSSQIEYYELIMGSPRLLAPGGIIVVDNTLWYSRVLRPPVADDSAETCAVRAFNQHVRSDSRSFATMLPLRDGLTLIQRSEPNKRAWLGEKGDLKVAWKRDNVGKSTGFQLHGPENIVAGLVETH